MLAACALFRPPDRTPELAPALADLRAAGFEFAPDVRLRNDPRAVCDGMSCADLVMENDRRTILVADGAFASPSKLRASLLEIWARYAEPRRGNVRDLAHAALVVIRDGPRAGVDRSRRARGSPLQLPATLGATARRQARRPAAARVARATLGRFRVTSRAH